MFVLAYKNGLPVYKKLGFEVVAEIMQDTKKYGEDHEYGVWFMVKKVKQDDLGSGGS